MTRSPSASADSKLLRGRPAGPSPGIEVTSTRCSLRQAPSATQAAPRERVWTRSTRSADSMRARRRTLNIMARGFSVAAGNGTCKAPIACASLASSPGSETTSARAPASINASATASVARRSPPVATGGAICAIVRPASGALAPRPNGESGSTLTRGFARTRGRGREKPRRRRGGRSQPWRNAAS